VKNKTLLAYVLPFVVFLGFLFLDSFVQEVFEGAGSVFFRAPKFWVYPLQTALCAGLLLAFWKFYTFAPLRPWPLGVLAGLAVLFLWISPQLVFGMPPRTEGFDPEFFGTTGALYGLTVLARFARLVIVVPLLEEIFWRGFLMRYLINERFTTVAFGTFRPLSFFGVAVLFMLVHSIPDWPAAFLTGLIYNGLAVKTKSLWACVLAHAVTNLGLGFYIMATRQWGFW